MWSCNLERIQNRALSSLRRVRGFTCVVCLVNVVEAMSTSNNSSQVNQDGTGKKKSVWSSYAYKVLDEMPVRILRSVSFKLDRCC
jgi:hypothetical protein